MSKLTKASHSPSELRCSALEHAWVHIPSVPIYTDGLKSSEVVGCTTVFLDLDVFISLPVVASISTAELCAIFIAHSRISFHDSNNFAFILTPKCPAGLWEPLYTQSLSSENTFFLTSTAVENLSPSAGSLHMYRSLATKRLMF